MNDTYDLDLARRYAPVVYFDTTEPFLPLYAGYTVFRAAGPSPSFPRYITLDPPVALAIEYAIWWDWDIQHLYELEHAWVFVDVTGVVVGVESSQHGAAAVGSFKLEDGRPVLYAEPGKHALASNRAQLLERRARTALECGRRAGVGGVWVTPLFRGRIAVKTPAADQLVRTHLRRLAFEPRWEWSRRVAVAELPLMPWRLLDSAIPQIIATRVAELEAALPHEQRHVLHIGHRGASAHAPENTLAAIRKAAELGAHMVELDVRMSADDVPVLAHDADVDVPGHGRVPIQSLTAAQLAAVTDDYETAIPRLDDVLARCRQLGLGPYLEIKEGAAVEPTVAMLSGRDLGKYSVIGSFNPAWVARASDRAPHIATSILLAHSRPTRSPWHAAVGRATCTRAGSATKHRIPCSRRSGWRRCGVPTLASSAGTRSVPRSLMRSYGSALRGSAPIVWTCSRPPLHSFSSAFGTLGYAHHQCASPRA